MIDPKFAPHPNSSRAKRTLTTTVRLDVDVYLALKDLSDRLHVSMAVIINTAVSRFVEARKEAKFGDPL